MEQLVGQPVGAGRRAMCAQHGPADVCQARLSVSELGHLPVPVGSKGRAGGVRGSPAGLPDNLPALPEHLESLALVSRDPAVPAPHLAQRMLGLQPGAAQPQVFGRSPGRRRLAERGFAGTPRLR
eukprot:618812-Alexandrium_andersonii.AAC.1